MNEREQNTVLDNSQETNYSQKPKQKKKNLFGLFFLLIITIATLVTLFHFGDFKETIKAMTQVNGWDMFYAVLCLVAYILLYPVSLCVLCKIKKEKSNPFENYLIGASEHFFNGITPYQTGAQPFQIYAFSRHGVKASNATGMVLVNFIALLIASNVMVICSLTFAPAFFEGFVNTNTLWIPIIGIVMNFFTLALFICIATCKWFRNILKGCIRILCKIKFIDKILSKFIPSFDAYCDNAQEASREIFSNIPAFLLVVLIRIVCLLFYYAIPFFILRALNINTHQTIIYSILATAFAVNAVVWIPTPGTSGGIEFAFTTIFAITGSSAAAAAILWRGFTYYILLIISFLQYLLLELIFKKKSAKEMVLDKESKKNDC